MAGALLERATRLRASVEPIAFWTAVLLPFAYVPLLVVGLWTPRRTGLFVLLAGLHLLALAAGHTYRR